MGATSTVGIFTTMLVGVRGDVLPGLTAGAVATVLVAAVAVLHLGARRRRDELLVRCRRLTKAP